MKERKNINTSSEVLIRIILVWQIDFFGILQGYANNCDDFASITATGCSPHFHFPRQNKLTEESF